MNTMKARLNIFYFLLSFPVIICALYIKILAGSNQNKIYFAYKKLIRRIYTITQKNLNINFIIPKIDPKKKYIITCNHQSLADTPIIIAALNKLGIQTNFILKKSLKKMPALGYIAQKLNFIFIDRNKPREIKKQIENIKNNKYLINNWMIFPEGKRSKFGYISPYNFAGIKWLSDDADFDSWLDITLIYHPSHIDCKITVIPYSKEKIKIILEEIWQDKLAQGLKENHE